MDNGNFYMDIFGYISEYKSEVNAKACLIESRRGSGASAKACH